MVKSVAAVRCEKFYVLPFPPPPAKVALTQEADKSKLQKSV